MQEYLINMYKLDLIIQAINNTSHKNALNIFSKMGLIYLAWME